ncbi:MAG: anthranilate synthase family protein [Blastococcus sp.]
MTGAAEVLELLSDDASFALIRHQGSAFVDVLLGAVHDAPSLAGIPLRADRGPGPDVLALVPYRQVTERGFVAHDDGMPLSCLVVERHLRVAVDDFVAACPPAGLTLADTAYDLDDDEYADVVRRIVRDEIGQGEGANFVVRRTLTARVENWSTGQGLGVFRSLLVNEKGAYWTFYVNTPDRTLVGASPERHITSRGGTVTMNPISGTFRMPKDGVSADDLRARLEAFLRDEKETLELMMVVDEELKMMAALCPEGGRVIGPFLKPMSHLVHTEYMLEGHASADPRDLLRGSMFAATVLGSPVENACRVIKRYETSGRGYYGALIAEFGRDADGDATLDAPIVIRTADIDRAGNLRASVGATLVRDSVPEDEVAETKAKIGGLLAALGAGPAAGGSTRFDVHDLVPADSPLLLARNARLSPFWLNESPSPIRYPELAGRTVQLISAEDDFANMLAHMLTSMGMQVQQTTWREVADGGVGDPDVLMIGPGPGDPRATDSPRIKVLRRLTADRLAARRPLVAVCLGHQVLASELGLELRPKRTVVQGAQERIDLFGRSQLVGFYNTFTAVLPADPGALPFECATEDDEVVALRGPGYAGLQFHAESVLTPDGRSILADAFRSALTTVPAGA